jgi:hypothetical protein
MLPILAKYVVLILDLERKLKNEVTVRLNMKCHYPTAHFVMQQAPVDNLFSSCSHERSLKFVVLCESQYKDGRARNIVKYRTTHYSIFAPGTSLGRLLDLLDTRHYEGGKVVTLTHRPSLPPGSSWYSFLEAESTSGHMVPSKPLRKIPSETTGDRSRDRPTSSAVP